MERTASKRGEATSTVRATVFIHELMHIRPNASFTLVDAQKRHA